LWCDAENPDPYGSFEPMPDPPRHHNELARTQRGGALHLPVEKEDCGGAVNHHDDLVAHRVAFPFALSNPVADEDCAVPIGGEPLERVRRVLVNSGRCSVRRNVSCSIASLIEIGTG
jgi:hypothetical protein